MGESIYDAVHPGFKFTYFTAKGVPEMHGQSFNPIDSAGSGRTGTQFEGVHKVDIAPLTNNNFTYGDYSYSDLLLGEVGTLEAFMEADQNDGRIASEYSWGFQELPVEAEWTVGNSALTPYEARANLMQAPFYNKSMRLSGPDAIANYVPFDSFRRTCSAFISGIPPIDSRGFLDHQTGFTYTNIKTVWGVGGTIRAAPDGGASTTEGVFDTDLFLKPLFNGELDGSTIPYVMGEESFTSMQPYFNLVLNATLPSEASAQLFYDHFLQPALRHNYFHRSG